MPYSAQPNAALSIALTVIAGGCSAPLNRSTSLGDPTRPTMTWTAQSIGSESAPGPRTGSWSDTIDRTDRAGRASGRDIDEPDQASITSLDRSAWGATRFLVPVDAIERRPRYTRSVIFNKTSARSRGEFPTVTSALDAPTTPGAEQQVLEAAAAPVAAAADIALAPIRMLHNRPLDRTRSGPLPSRRSPRTVKVFDASPLEGVGLSPLPMLAEDADSPRDRPEQTPPTEPRS
jgi:hypothetical protein